MLYEFYFCSTVLGDNPEAWEQRTVIEAENRDQAKIKFIEKLGIPYMSDSRLDYVDCTKIYNRTKIDNLDPRQLIYVNYHEEQYGTDRLIINEMDYEERTEVNHPSEEQIAKMLIGYEDREAYLWNNMRGYSLVFRTESNEDMFTWENLEKVN